MKTHRLQVLIALATVAVVLALRGLAHATGLVTPDSQAGPPHPLQLPAGLGGEYIGRVDLTDVVLGHYADALATVTPAPSPTRPPGTLTPAPPVPVYGGKVELGLDLVLHLQTSGCEPPAAVCGHVVLDRTLGFHTLAYPQLRVVQATPVGPTPLPGNPPHPPRPLAVGPRVSGSVNGSTLTLESELFTQMQAAERRIPTPPVGPQTQSHRAPGQTVERQFRIVATLQDDGGVLTGEYRETMTRVVDGLRGYPATAVGRVSISRPAFEPSLAPGPTSTPGPRGFRIFVPHLSRERPHP